MRILTIFSGILVWGTIYAAAAGAQGGSTTQGQDGIESSNPVFEYMEPLTPEGLKAMIFPDTKDGCARWASFVFAFAEQYPEAATPERLEALKIGAPLAEGVFRQVRTQGKAATEINAVREYSACAKNARPETDEKREARQQEQHKKCEALNEVVLGTLTAIGNKTPQEKTLRKYQGKNLDTEDTILEDIESPAAFLINQLYNTARDKSPEAAAETGAAVSISCISRIH